MAPSSSPSLRVLLAVACVLGLAGPLSIVVAVAAVASLTLALAAGLAACLAVIMVALAGCWWLIQQLETFASRPLDARPAVPTEPGKPTPDASAREVGRVLVADDDPVSQRVTAHLLRRLGYPADVVADGQAAIDAVAANRYTLVLMDCQMPGIDGYTATAEIRQHEASTGAARVTIVALTASTLDTDRARCFAAGMDAYLLKPIDDHRLTALLDRWAPHPAARPLIELNAARTPATTGASADRTSMHSPDAAAASAEAWPASRTESALDLAPILDPTGLLGAGSTLSPQHQEIVELFFQEAPRRLSTIDEALARGDRDRVARVAHTLAGSASSLGAARLAVACAHVETLARNADRPLADVAEAIGTIRHELDRLRAAIAGSREN